MNIELMLTVRPLDKNGKWQPKTQKEYLCIRNGIEKAFTPAECKVAEREGWEKQYLYKLGDEKMYLPPSRAVKLERINRYPKATKYGRQNPIYEEWNSEEQLMRFREAWARYVNRELETCEVDERIDHRSYKARGIDRQPTVHEGVSAKKLALRGMISIRRKRNELIKESNRLSDILMELTVALVKLVGELILIAADGLESLRSDLLVLTYQKNEDI